MLTLACGTVTYIQVSVYGDATIRRRRTLQMLNYMLLMVVAQLCCQPSSYVTIRPRACIDVRRRMQCEQPKQPMVQNMPLI